MLSVKENNTNTTNTTLLQSNQGLKPSENILEQRVYATAHQRFTQIDADEEQLKNSLATQIKKKELISSELESLEKEIDKAEGFSKILGLSLIVTKKTEIENIECKLDETLEKQKKIKEHPLHQSNRKNFLGELESPYNRYTSHFKSVQKESEEKTQSKKGPCDYCFSLADQGYDLAGIMKAVKQADRVLKQNQLESQLTTYAAAHDRTAYRATYEELCKKHTDTILTINLNEQEYAISINATALESLLNETVSTLTINLPEETLLKQATQCLTLIREYLTIAQIKTFDKNTLPTLQLLLKKQENGDNSNFSQQLQIVKALQKNIEEQFFYALLDENITEMKRIGSIFGSDNFSLEWRIPIAQINEESHTYKTQGQWINKKLQLIDQSPYQNDTQKKEFAEKALNEYKTLLSDEKEFHQAFPTFKESGFSTTPYLYCALNKYQPNTQIQFDTIDEKEQIKKGSYTLTCHLDAILPHLPFAQNLIHFNQAQTNNIPRVSNDPYSETLCITLPLEYEEGLEKVYAYLKNLDPTQLRTTQQTETIALFQLCQYWGIKEHDSVIFHNYSEKELTDKELFSLACDTNSQYLLQKSIRALLQQGGQSEDQYDNALELFIKCNPPIEKLDLTGLNLTDPLIKLLKYSKENLKG
jgi:hypothetical protein